MDYVAKKPFCSSINILFNKCFENIFEQDIFDCVQPLDAKNENTQKEWHQTDHESSFQLSECQHLIRFFLQFVFFGFEVLLIFPQMVLNHPTIKKSLKFFVKRFVKHVVGRKKYRSLLQHVSFTQKQWRLRSVQRFTDYFGVYIFVIEDCCLSARFKEPFAGFIQFVIRPVIFYMTSVNEIL